MVNTFYTKENKPFPNNPLPVLYYPKVLANLIDEPDPAHSVLDLFEKNGYRNGWVNGIFSYHHFHSNTHEVLACIAGEATVQLGGPDTQSYSFSEGDVLLLPAGVAHKRVAASPDFKIVGAYPEGLEPDMQKGGAENYESIKQAITAVQLPKKDPAEGANGSVANHWV